MKRFFLKSKIHRASVTAIDMDYEGSIALDEELMKAADLEPFEKVDVYNVSNGERFSTYVIKAEKGSRTVGVYGAAAHKAKAGDTLIIAAYALFDDGEIDFFTPKVVLLNGENRIADVR